MQKENDAYDVPSGAARLKITEKAMRARIARRQVPFRKLGARIIIPHDELERYIAGLNGVSVEEALERVRSPGGGA